MIYKGDKSSDGVFSCMLGDVPAQSEASLVLKYVTELPQEPDGQLRFTLPTVLNPRYSSDKGDKKAGKNDKNVAPSKVPYKFSMTATVKAYHKVTSVTSETVKLNVTFEEDNKIAKVVIGDDFKFDRDMQLCVLYEKPYSPQVILGNRNPKSEEVYKKDTCMLSFLPDLRKVSIATNGEYVFIIEISGKMEGTKMGNAKKALQLFLRSLPADCFFNVICYAAKVNSLFRNSNKYTEKTLKEAFIFLEKMKTDITNNADIFKALDHIYGKKPISGHPRKVFLLTDGKKEYNAKITSQVTDLVKKQTQKTNTRIFILAMDYGYSTVLFKDVAHIGFGRAEFIKDNERVQTKAIALLKYSMQPAITNVEVKWDIPSGLSVDLIPEKPQNVISAGERLVIFAAIQGVKENTTNAPCTVTLKGVQDGKALTRSMTFDILKSDDVTVSAAVHHLATKAQIKLLEDQEEEFVAFHNPEILQWVEFCSDISSLRQKIKSFSCHSNIISKYTFYSALNGKGENVVKDPGLKFSKVPTLTDIFICELKVKLDMYYKANLKSFGLVEQFGGDDKDEEEEEEILAGKFAGRKEERRPAHKFKEQQEEEEEEERSPQRKLKKNLFCKKLKNQSSLAACVSDNSGGAVLVMDDDQMMTVLSLQQFQGQWIISAELLQLVGIVQEDVEKMDISKDLSVVCTAIVLGWLMEMYPHRQDEWQMIETKALSWMSSQSQITPVEEVIQQTTQAFWTH
ncbi:von Willebrand factor A domain-containing protein 5A-like [Ruditapes philippinarum]|uniref:von Willebrand factor A domain-containing protein 5A-like n=1 Tax=Ruditapes philippinarum TaxID=129788 RepID=UPI00295BB656|nr:von Willebrand factor A domain-containing protein 5A-like [Ruditapes philippinarum]